MGTVRFGNDHFAAITRYGDYVQGNLMIGYVYYVEVLGHNLFLVKQFCDGDLEVAFRSNTCYVWNIEGDDLLTGSQESNLYIISIFELASSSPVCLMFKAASTKSWLWHRRLSHLNFGQLGLDNWAYLLEWLGFGANGLYIPSIIHQMEPLIYLGSPFGLQRKTGIWSGRKADSSKRNIVFSPEMKLHYFDMNDMEFDDMENVVEEVEHGNFF
ncbi:integrase, catalytic region, zinc finger, CCHC-type containing protein [Tanacetum coccineum]|uniref:Integrase, catalytic region, zinc finger, CCHC-type containing protein n=1 Tax=Tanacetum coccineum TaxID=301880 RepID=A0ABQ5GAL9_9ASTR